MAERKFCPEGPQKVDFCYPGALTRGMCVPWVYCTLGIKVRRQMYVIGVGLVQSVEKMVYGMENPRLVYRQ